MNIRINTILKAVMISHLMFYSCGETKKTKNLDELLENTDLSSTSISDEVYNDMIQTLPQPIEIAGIISSSKMDFSKALLIPENNSMGYQNKYYQAMALGAFGVDLGYINLQEKGLYVLNYLEAIKTISEQLDVDEFFDFASLSEMARNMNDVDSLIQTSTKNFKKIDDFFKEKHHGELSILILTGAWLEGMNMFVEMEEKSNSVDLINRIGEQKIVFQNIQLILEKINTIPHFKQLESDFDFLKKCYENVTIKYIYKEPIAQEVEGELVFVDQSETIVEISESQIKCIRNEIRKIRQKYFINLDN